MPFKSGNEEWKKRRVCRGGRPTKEELAKRKIEKREFYRVAKIYARVKAVQEVESFLGLGPGVCLVCKQPTA